MAVSGSEKMINKAIPAEQCLQFALKLDYGTLLNSLHWLQDENVNCFLYGWNFQYK